MLTVLLLDNLYRTTVMKPLFVPASTISEKMISIACKYKVESGLLAFEYLGYASCLSYLKNEKAVIGIASLCALGLLVVPPVRVINAYRKEKLMIANL